MGITTPVLGDSSKDFGKKVCGCSQTGFGLGARSTCIPSWNDGDKDPLKVGLCLPLPLENPRESKIELGAMRKLVVALGGVTFGEHLLGCLRGSKEDISIEEMKLHSPGTQAPGALSFTG